MRFLSFFSLVYTPVAMKRVFVLLYLPTGIKMSNNSEAEAIIMTKRRQRRETENST
jgi:hypothetical protein